MSGPEDQYPSRAEQLTLNFYLWERRGRGWPVELEPPFQPFYHQQFYQPPQIDDGRKPTFLSSLTEGFLKNSTNEPQSQEVTPLDGEPYPLLPVPFADLSPLTHVTVSLSPQSKVTLDQAEHFLLNLRYCTQPVAFELFGTHEAITLGFTSRSTDFSQVRQQLQAYSPEAVLSQESDFIRNKWDDEKQTVIIDFGLSNEFMRPLRTFRNVDPDPLIGMAGAEELEEEEVGLLQVLFQAARHPWQESILRSVTDLEGRPFFLDAPDMIPLAKEKVQTPFFGVVIRVAIEISSTSKAGQEVQNIRKCLDAGYDYVICVCADEKSLPLLKKESRKSFTLREWERLRFLLPSQVKEFLYRPPILGMDSEKRVVSGEISQQKQFLDTNEASKFLGISKSTLYEWIVQKKVPHLKVGRLVKFRKEELEAWLKQRTKDEERKNFFP